MGYISNALREAYNVTDYSWFFLLLFLPFLAAAFILRFSAVPVRKKCGRAALAASVPGAVFIIIYLVMAVRLFVKYLSCAAAEGRAEIITSDHPSLKALHGTLNSVSSVLYFLEAGYVPVCGLFLIVIGFLIWKTGRKSALACIITGVIMALSLFMYLQGLRELVY